jgi:predicted metal-dependent hydrolase
MRFFGVVTDRIVVGDISIEVTRKRIKHVHLRVHAPDGRVTMSAPRRTSLRVVEAFAIDRLKWIRRQQERVRSRPREASLRYVDGERHSLWGRELFLSVVERDGRPGVTVEDGRITLFVRPGADTAKRAAALHAWHRKVLQEALPPLLRTWELRMNVRLTGYSLRRMKTRWGTCNHRAGHIRLNTELVTRPSHLLEYVLVHELAHLIVPNHGPRFVSLMNAHYPNWRQARAELNGSMFRTTDGRPAALQPLAR